MKLVKLTPRRGCVVYIADDDGEQRAYVEGQEVEVSAADAKTLISQSVVWKVTG